MSEVNAGVIYILTNPSFPQYVKIGYADDVNQRLTQLNRSECIPFAFRLYAYYKVPTRLTDMKLHALIDKLNPNLRAIDDFNGKKRVREFYAMEAHDAYSILETIAEINGLKDNLVLVEPTLEDIEKENEAEEIRTRKSPQRYPKFDWLIEQNILHIGDRICVINHPNQFATVVDGNGVEYCGDYMSYNQFGCLITGWKTIQAYAMMKIEGKNETLSELRYNKMKELGMIE